MTSYVISKNVKEQFTNFGAGGALVFGLLTWLLLAVLLRGTEPEGATMSAEHVAIPLAPVDAVRITILMDNVTDPLLFPTQHVERTTWFHHLAKPRVGLGCHRGRPARCADRRSRASRRSFA